MLAKLHTFSLLGIEAIPVDVEVDVSPATMPKTILVGLPAAAVKESTHRVERANVNSGSHRLRDRVAINLAPAEFPKNAASFDLPYRAERPGGQAADAGREPIPSPAGI